MYFSGPTARLLLISWALLMTFSVVGFCNDPPPTPTPRSPSAKNLSEYAKGRKLRQTDKTNTPKIVISDDNLEKMGSGVELTAVTQVSPKIETPVGETDDQDPRRNWRSRIQEHLDVIDALEAQGNLIDEEISRLWEMFYACDEPGRREDQIRPKLVQKIEEKNDFLKKFDLARLNLEKTLEDARENGIPPGWYRDILR